MRTFTLFSAVAVLAMILGPGCGDDDDYGDAAAAKLRACGLLTVGRFGDIQEPTTAADRCEYDCALAASCDDLTAMMCQVGSPSPGFEACFDNCGSSAGDFDCLDGLETIPGDWVCDGYDDCADGSDEAGCSMFDCLDGTQSVPLDYVCDYEEDCYDGSDEVGCSTPPQFQCGDGSFIANYMDCDGETDCPDGSDEVGCAEMTCPMP